MEILAALAGAVVGGLFTIIWERIQLPRRLLNALRAELAVNKELCLQSLEINRRTLAELKKETDAWRDQTIDDDFKVYVVMPINIPLETWGNQNYLLFKQKNLISFLLKYKAILGRVEYLVSRHQAFRFRPYFIMALIDAHEKLVVTINEFIGKIDDKTR